jgi:hypothetical protein
VLLYVQLSPAFNVGASNDWAKTAVPGTDMSNSANSPLLIFFPWIF